MQKLVQENQPQDQWQRNQALNIEKSFIVQAPAGSGKTSLLVQRYLALLANANYPEEILAITFTRKASHEMQERILQALFLAKKASSKTKVTDEGIFTEEILAEDIYDKDISDKKLTAEEIANEKITDDELATNPQKSLMLNLAKKVLLKDQQRNWQLLTYPQRLRLLTIDALCSSLVKTSPFLANISTDFSIVSGLEADKIYHQAINNLLESIENTTCFFHKDLVDLLTYFDNDIEQCEKLLLHILQKRDQWLHYVVIAKHAESDELKRFLEKNISQIIIDHLNLCQNCIPTNLHNQLIYLMNFSYSNNCNDSNNDSDKVVCDTNDDAIFNAYENIPPIEKNNFFDDLFADKTHCQNLYKRLKQWQYIANTLLSGKSSWRKTVTKKNGFPTSNKLEKNEFMSLLQELANLPQSQHILQIFSHITKLPIPQYSKKQFNFLQNLTNILPILVAELNLLFQQNNVYDYVAIALNVEKIFGDNEQPSDLALYLDYKLHHILVDEFQDISQSQYRLLQKLTYGWSNDGQKTLFCVGDPMQSIYRFRQAEVGLFLHTIQHGIGNIKLKLLRLTNNFRSKPEIIQWFNRVFKQIFPQHDNINNGEIAFTESTYLDTKLFTDLSTKLSTELCTELYANSPINLSIKSTNADIDTVTNTIDAELNNPFPAINIEVIPAMQNLDFNINQDAYNDHDDNKIDNNFVGNYCNNEDNDCDDDEDCEYADAQTISTTIQTIEKIHASYPQDKITILVRAKTHLNQLLPALKLANIPFDAIELESLNSSMVIQDLLSLTLALNDLNHRIAWLSILRNPWCGLSLHDLYLITNSDEDPSIPLWFLIQQNDLQQKLSLQGQQILENFIPIIDNALKNRGRCDFVKWIELTWLDLNAPAYITDLRQLSYVEEFWQILKSTQNTPMTIDLDLLTQKLQQIYVNQINENAYVQIMTIHKAKGLDCDHVILYGLEKPTRADDKAILMWFEYLSSYDDENNENNYANHHDFVNLVLAPLETLDDNKHKIYSYLRYLEKQKNDNENIRLLYVAITRAKKSLHIIAQIKTIFDKESSNKILKIPKNCLLYYLGLLF